MSQLPSHDELHRFAMKPQVFRQDVLDWCQLYVANYWRPISTQWLHILIENKQDAMFFKLSWSEDIRRHKEPTR